jgi:hypothetical protein
MKHTSPLWNRNVIGGLHFISWLLSVLSSNLNYLYCCEEEVSLTEVSGPVRDEKWGGESSGPTGSLQAGIREGGGWVESWGREEIGPFQGSSGLFLYI